MSDNEMPQLDDEQLQELARNVLCGLLENLNETQSTPFEVMLVLVTEDEKQRYTGICSSLGSEVTEHILSEMLDAVREMRASARRETLQ